jgi:hypothetical protein
VASVKEQQLQPRFLVLEVSEEEEEAEEETCCATSYDRISNIYSRFLWGRGAERSWGGEESVFPAKI